MFNGISGTQYYLTDFKDSNSLIESFLNDLLTPENSGSYWYAHNSSNFDLIFLIKYLLQRDNIKLKTIYKGGKFLQINVKYKVYEEEYQLTLFDSYLILLSSLDKLANNFDVDSKKGIYPYTFANENNLNYVGEVPDFKYFDKKISLSEYNNYKSKYNYNWSLKNETNNYCFNDCIVLHKIIVKFRELMLDYFRVDITKSPTAASLSMRVYRAKYLKNKIIPNIPIEIYNILVNSYFGGHVDLYMSSKLCLN